nr:MAG TPA: hypothetical protein [Caudoviricetes sp.]
MTGFIIVAVVFITTACAVLNRRFNAECERDNATRAYWRAKQRYYSNRQGRA